MGELRRGQLNPTLLKTLRVKNMAEADAGRPEVHAALRQGRTFGAEIERTVMQQIGSGADAFRTRVQKSLADLEERATAMGRTMEDAKVSRVRLGFVFGGVGGWRARVVVVLWVLNGAEFQQLEKHCDHKVQGDECASSSSSTI